MPTAESKISPYCKVEQQIADVHFHFVGIYHPASYHAAASYRHSQPIFTFLRNRKCYTDSDLQFFSTVISSLMVRQGLLSTKYFVECTNHLSNRILKRSWKTGKFWPCGGKKRKVILLFSHQTHPLLFSAKPCTLRSLVLSKTYVHRSKRVCQI